jgi:hypothetical protein
VASVRIGYIEDFKGDQTLLIEGDQLGLTELARLLEALGTRTQTAIHLHSLGFVAMQGKIEVNAIQTPQDLGILRAGQIFLWQRSSTGWAAVGAKILGVAQQGKCHQYLDTSADEVAVVVSTGEYGDQWPTDGATV